MIRQYWWTSFSKAKSLTFVAASCDFSDIAVWDSSFWKRPNCYPLRNDWDFSSDWNDQNWSGIFFKMTTLQAVTD